MLLFAALDFVFQQAFEQFKSNDLSFSLNLAFQDIENIHTRNFIFKKIESAPHLRGRITFEILESEDIKNYALISDFIVKAKEMGCQIAIDDFGSGYSNFENLLNLPINIVKINGTLIQQLMHNQMHPLTVRGLEEAMRALSK